MKTLIVSLFLFQLAGLAQDEAPAPQEDRQGVVVQNENDVLASLIEDMPQLSEFIATCNEPSNRQSGENKDGCVWRLVQGAGLAEQVTAALDRYRSPAAQGEEGEATSPPAEGEDAEGNRYNYNIDNFKVDKKESTALLEEYLRKRMEKILHEGDTPQDPNRPTVKAASDHTDFYRIWQSQLGKSLITELSRYCIHADPRTGLVPHENTDDHKKMAAYFKSLNVQNIGQIQNEKSKAFHAFNTCLSFIPRECLETISGPYRDLGSIPDTGDFQLNQLPTINQRFISYDSLSDDEKNALSERIKERIVHPCELNRYMTGVKKSLKEVETLVGQLNENVSGKREFGIQVNNMRARQEPVNTDRIVNVSSGELLSDENQEYQDKVAEEAELLAQCQDSGATDAGCEQFITQEEEARRIQDEAYIRGLALKQRLEDELLNDSVTDPEVLKQFFTEKGMSDETFEKMLSQKIADEAIRAERAGETPKDPATLLKELIEKTYDKEREAIENSLQARLKETTLGGEPEDPSMDRATPQFETLSERARNSPEDLAVVYHYANVVSSFLDVTDADGSATKNTAALAAELANNAFEDGSGRATASGGSGVTSDLGALDGMGDPQPSSGESSGAQLGADQIDQIQFGIREEEP